MSERELIDLLQQSVAASWRVRLAKWVESPLVQKGIVAIIIINAAILGLETSADAMKRWGPVLKALDFACLGVFICELLVKLVAYRWQFWRSGWNVFDFLVVAVALAPGAGPWSVLRAMRIFRVLRLLTVVPQLRKVVAAFIHAIPGLSGVIVVATFTILNLFIGIIVSTMQELSMIPEAGSSDAELKRTLERMEKDLAMLRKHLDTRGEGAS